MNRGHRIRRLSAALVTMSVLAFGAEAATAGAASAASCTASDYVVGSAPLENVSTGISSWSYGYVQLWYSNTCQTNWTRVVSLVSGTNGMYASLDRSDGTFVQAYSPPTSGSCSLSVCVSPSLYSPSDADNAFGQASTATALYQASYDQF